MKTHAYILLGEYMAVRSVFACVLCFVLVGCDSDTYYDWMYKGTALGFAHCIKGRTAGGMSDSLAKVYCIKRHEAPVGPWVSIGGSALYSPSPISFWGSVTNKSDYIITAFIVTVRHKDNPGEGDTKRFDNQYIEPQKSVNFSIDGHDLKFKPNLPARANDFEWNLYAVQGIKLQ